MKDWTQIDRKVVLDRAPFLRVEDHTVRAPRGEVIPDWTWLVTPDYVNIVPVTGDGRFVCLRETKYGIEGASLAAVGGFVDGNEPPIEAAKRELIEETGYTAPDWVHLGDYRVDCNRGAGMAHFYLATGAVVTAEPDSGDLEEHEILLLKRAEVEEALDRGGFKSLSWAASVALALRRLG